MRWRKNFQTTTTDSTKTKSLRFNLAYAEGFEAVTMHVVKHLMEPNGFGEDLPMFLQMWEWHFVEELEHRTVAFDVYDHVCGGYLYRLVVGAWAQWHFSRWVRRVVKYMMSVRPPPKLSAAGEGEAGEGGAEEDIPDTLNPLGPAICFRGCSASTCRVTRPTTSRSHRGCRRSLTSTVSWRFRRPRSRHRRSRRPEGECIRSSAIPTHLYHRRAPDSPSARRGTRPLRLRGSPVSLLLDVPVPGRRAWGDSRG